MRPLDDELRDLLHSRAGGLAPSPDPLAGIEQRARTMRRHRVAASVAASVVAVAAVAAVVPALQRDGGPGPAPRVATSVAPTLTPAPASYALNPRDPWTFRGVAVDESTRAAIQGEYATKRQAAEVLVTPLFAQVYEPSQQLEVVFLAEVDGAYRWGVVVSTEAGPKFPWDAALDEGRESLAAALPGDEAPRLLVVASPQAVALDYAPDGSGFRAMGELERGVAVVPLDGDPASDRYRVSWPGASVTDDAPDVPDRTAPPVSEAEARPANALDWPRRGSIDPELEARAVRGFATALGAGDSAAVGYTVLFTGDNDPGQKYVVMQAWMGDGPAYSFGWIESPGADPEPVLQPVLTGDEQAVAILLTGIPGRSTDELIVVPQPKTGEVLYRATPAEQYRPVSTPGLDGIALVDRALGADQDELRLLDGNGDLDKPTFEGRVADLLCGLKGCG